MGEGASWPRSGRPTDDLDWLLAVDADGLTSRWDLADAIRDRYRLRISSIDLVEELHEGVVANTRLDPLVACALRIADDAGWVPVVVTNGARRAQEAKIRRTGLDRYVADWVISEEVGVSKPNPRIFALAAQRVRMRLQRRLGGRRQPGGRHRRRGRDGPAQRVAAPRPGLAGRAVRAHPYRRRGHPGPRRRHGQLTDARSALRPPDPCRPPLILHLCR